MLLCAPPGRLPAHHSFSNCSPITIAQGRFTVLFSRYHRFGHDSVKVSSGFVPFCQYLVFGLITSVCGPFLSLGAVHKVDRSGQAMTAVCEVDPIVQQGGATDSLDTVRAPFQDLRLPLADILLLARADRANLRPKLDEIIDQARWLADMVLAWCGASGGSRTIPEGSNGAHIGD
jgi:hypothetical protein